MPIPYARRRTTKWIAVFAVIALLRVGVLVAGWSSLDADPDAYRSLASTWHELGVYGTERIDGNARPTAYRPPLYPWMLSWFSLDGDPNYDKPWIAWLHVVTGVLTCIMTAHLGRMLGLSRIAAALASLLVACDPILLRQSTLVMTETIATFVGVGIWWYWVKQHRHLAKAYTLPARKRARDELLVGLAMGLAILCRPTMLAWSVLWAVASIRKKRWRSTLLWAFGASLLVGPWAVRNLLELGAPVLTTTHGGYTLYLANNPVLYEHWRQSVSREWDEDAFHARWRQERAESGKDTEVEVDQVAQGLAIETIRSQPGMFLWGAVIRLGWFWAWWPSERQASLGVQLAIGGWYALVISFAAIGGYRVVRARAIRSLWLPGLLLVASLSAVHAVYWSNMRMRAPAVPTLCLLAGSVLRGVARPELRGGQTKLSTHSNL